MFRKKLEQAISPLCNEKRDGKLCGACNRAVDSIILDVGKLITQQKEPCTEHWKHEERVNKGLPEYAELEYIIPNRIDCPECQAYLKEQLK